MLLIVDYGMGNLRSVAKAFRRLGTTAEVSGDPDRVRRADKLVLPGVGHFAEGMKNLRAAGLADALDERVRAGVPILGICLGVQLFTRSSEEGGCAGLGWVDGRVVRMVPPGRERVPHIGWNTVSLARPDPVLGAVDGASFYFVHSYHLSGMAAGEIVATTRYGIEFACAIRKDNIFGTQFHPEKSHARGLGILERFACTARA